VARWVTVAELGGVERRRLKSQYASTPMIPMTAMIGRNTKGGLVMMSRPLMPPVPPVRTPDAGGGWLAEGVGEEVPAGDGVTPGVGVGGAWRAKDAQGCG
jgi:hypothetical protein